MNQAKPAPLYDTLQRDCPQSPEPICIPWRLNSPAAAASGQSRRTMLFGQVSIANLIPANGAAVADTTPTLRWDAVGDAVRYELQIAGSAAELSGETAVSAATASYTFSEALANGQTRYWRVRAIGANGLLGPWSSSSSFMVQWGIMTGLSPADGASTTDTTPTLSWAGVPGAASYEVRIADSLAGPGQCVINQCNRQFLHADIGLDERADSLLAGEGKGWGWTVWGLECGYIHSDRYLFCW